ncbi:sensor domain-containing diguanylate cyclase [Colwellia sp. MEBiC06753]
MQKHAPPQSTAPSQRYPLACAVLLGLIGAFINCFAIPFLPEVKLIFGNALIIMAAMCLRPALTLLTALIAVTPLYFVWGHPFGFITFSLEALIIAHLRSKGIYVLFADIGYWVIIGMPITALIIWLNSDQATVNWLFISLKQGLNAALYTSLGCLVVFVLGKKWRFSWNQQPVIKTKLRNQLNYAMVLMICLALPAATLFISRGLITSSQSIIKTTLEDRAEKFSELINIYIDSQKHAVSIAASWLSEVPPSTWQSTIKLIHQNYDEFSTMITVDLDGSITNATPLEMLEDSDVGSVSDRDYFQQAIATKSLYVSPVFIGRGFGQAIIFAISSPIFSPVNNQQLIGVVEGSVTLDFIGNLSNAQLGDEQIKLVVTDNNSNIIFAHPSLNYGAMENFQYQEVDDIERPNRLVLEKLPNYQFSFAKSSTVDGWSVYALTDYNLTIKEIEREYMVILITLLITLLITALIAYRFGQRITLPLDDIVKQMNKFDKDVIKNFAPLAADAALEIDQLYEQLKSEKRVVKEHRHHLEEEVHYRTQELKDLNKKLEALALKDGLTEVYNRRFLDNNFPNIQKAAQRNLALMAVIMLDLDHFKRLNDNYGHLMGDKVLKRIAQLIKEEFSRETDKVVRFGGEEFLIIAPYITVAALSNKLELLRVRIEEAIFTDEHQQRFHTSASFGAIIADAEFSENLLVWVKKADECMYQAKESGRNKVVIVDEISRANH